MYTYTKTFAGVALNQFDTRSVENELFLEFLPNLGEYALADVDLDILDDFELDQKSEAWNKDADKSKLHEITDDINDKFKLL